MIGTTLDIDDVRDIVSEFVIRPGGLWTYEADVDDTNPDAPMLKLVAYTRDSRDERYFDECPPDELPSPLTFTFVLQPDDMDDEDSVVYAVCRAVATFAAHEALEWTRYKGRMPHDPHIHGAPVVDFR